MLPRPRSVVRTVVVLLLAGHGTSPGQILGPEFQVNTTTAGHQWLPAVAARGEGDFVVVWQSQDGWDLGIYGQRFDGAGAPAGPEFLVNSATPGPQRLPAVAMDGGGGFVVAFESGPNPFAPFVRRFDADGIPRGLQVQVNEYSPSDGDQGWTKVGTNAAGEFVVAWSHYYDQDPFQYWEIRARSFDAAGLPTSEQLLVAPWPYGRLRAAGGAAINDAGEFVIAWHQSSFDSSGYEIYGRHFAAGAPTAEPFAINSFTTSDQRNPALAMDPTGRFVVAWNSEAQDGSDDGVFGRRFNASALPRGGEFQVNSRTTGWQSEPAIAVDVTGNFLVVWTGSDQDGSGKGVFAQRFSSSGAPLGGELQVNVTTTGDQLDARVASIGRGDFVVVWADESGQDGNLVGVFARRLTGGIFFDGFEAGDACAWSGTVGGGCPQSRDGAE